MAEPEPQIPMARPVADAMDSCITFLDCPAHLDRAGSQRCGLPAEVRCCFVMRSSDGPLESVMIRCPAGHWFNGPIEFLSPVETDDRQRDAAAPFTHISGGTR